MSNHDIMNEQRAEFFAKLSEAMAAGGDPGWWDRLIDVNAAFDSDALSAFRDDMTLIRDSLIATIEARQEKKM